MCHFSCSLILAFQCTFLRMLSIIYALATFFEEGKLSATQISHFSSMLWYFFIYILYVKHINFLSQFFFMQKLLLVNYFFTSSHFFITLLSISISLSHIHIPSTNDDDDRNKLQRHEHKLINFISCTVEFFFLFVCASLSTFTSRFMKCDKTLH